MKAIEISIGIVFVYLLLSLIATIVMEIIAGSTAQRGKLLKKTIAKILGDQNLVKDFSIPSTFYPLPLPPQHLQQPLPLRHQRHFLQLFPKFFGFAAVGHHIGSGHAAQQINESVVHLEYIFRKVLFPLPENKQFKIIHLAV